MSVSAENIADTPASRNSERIEEATNRILNDVIEERIKTNLRPLNEQIYSLTQLLNQFIQESSARNSPTADTRTQQTQSIRSPSNEAGTSRVLPASAIGSTGFRPTNGITRSSFLVWQFMVDGMLCMFGQPGKIVLKSLKSKIETECLYQLFENNNWISEHVCPF